jgi:hypothetical protein
MFDTELITRLTSFITESVILASHTEDLNPSQQYLSVCINYLLHLDRFVLREDNISDIGYEDVKDHSFRLFSLAFNSNELGDSVQQATFHLSLALACGVSKA